jgi:hypothetical protein
MAFQIREVVYKPVEIAREDLATMAEAARITGLTMTGLTNAIERGQLDEVIDTEAGYHGRRLLLREQLARFEHGRVKATR